MEFVRPFVIINGQERRRMDEKKKELLEQFLVKMEEQQKTIKKYCSTKGKVRKRLTPEQIRRIDEMRQH